MEHSEIGPQLFIRTTLVTPNGLVSLLDTVNAVVPFRTLMADYWNSPGTFADYEVGKDELTPRVEDCMTGNAFGPSAEMRWRKVGDRFRVVLVAEVAESQLGHAARAVWQKMVKEENEGEIVKLDSRESADVVWVEEKAEVGRCVSHRTGFRLLWGTKCLHQSQQSSRWIEARIPRPLDYPTRPEEGSDYEHVHVHLVEYLDERGRVCTFRRTRLSAHLHQSKAQAG